MEMEQWDERGDSNINANNGSSVDYNGDNNDYSYTRDNDDQYTNDNYPHNNEYEKNAKNINYVNDSNDNHYSNRSNAYNQSNNYSHYSNNRRYVARNNSYNNYNGNGNRRNDYRSQQYSNYNNNNRYRGNRNRGNNNRYSYDNRRSNYQHRNRNQNTFNNDNSRFQRPRYQPKQTQNTQQSQKQSYANENTRTPSYQTLDTNQNQPEIETNNGMSRPTRPKRREKFKGRNIANNFKDNQEDTTTTTANQSNPCYEADEAQSQMRQYHQQNQSFSQTQTQYNRKPKRHSLELDNLTDRPKEMALQLMNGTYDCMVCQSLIGKKGRIWKCEHCYTIFHITCVNKWARAREQKDAEAEQRPVKPDREITKIRCPACNYIDVNFKYNQYKCFCSKVIFDHEHRSTYNYASSIPHSCANPCNKTRGPLCPHQCQAICHPGPCDPCTLPSNRKSTCPCGKLSYALLCGDQRETKPRLCGQTCERLLKCNNHRCTLKCHTGDCDGCDIKSEQSCFCGKQQKLQPCGSGQQCTDEKKENVYKYSCAKVCNKLLSCGNHKCTLICHNGSCSGCPRRIDHPTRCACGKSTVKHITRESCLDPLPVCKSKCGKMLGCATHFCRRNCHDSKCHLCMLQIKKKCRCGASDRKFKCHDYEKRLKSFVNNINNQNALVIDGQDSWIRCGKKCKRVKSCGKHICAEICCRGRNIRTYFDGHQCRELCNKPLSCGRHKCSSYCHRGSCNPCGVTYRNGVECACGTVFVSGPFQCGTKAIPRCDSACDKVLGCGHLCAAKCHHGACPPCIRVCSKPCVSHGLLVHNMPCHVQNRSCGNMCGTVLECGTHKCNRTCHFDACQEVKSGINNFKNGHALGCGQSCGLALKCGHKCMYKCHTQRQCDSNACKVQIDVKCKCGENSSKQYCKGRTEYELKAVPCTEECKIAQRNKRFREALHINTAKNTKKKDTEMVNSERKESGVMIPYAASVLERILKWMSEDKGHTTIVKENKRIIAPKFVYYMEGLLSAYVCDKSENGKVFRHTYSDITCLVSSNGEIIINLKPMNSEQRFIVYSMATQYHIRTEKKENGGKYGLSYIELSKSKHARMTDYLLSQALIEYQLKKDQIRTLESMPPQTIIVIDNGEKISSSIIQDRLLAWTGDYRMFRIETVIYIVFTDTNARNSAYAEIHKKFGARKANKSDSLSLSQYKKQQQKHKKNRLKQKEMQQSSNSNSESQSKSNKGWSTKGNAHAITVNAMAKRKPLGMNVKMGGRF